MNKLKKCLGAGLAIGLLALSVMVPVKSHAASVIESATVNNKFPPANVGVHDKLDFYGMKVKRIVLSSADALLVTGAGFLDMICASGGTLGKYSMAYDTADTAYNSSVTSSANYAISPTVFTSTDTTSSNANKGCWIPPAPIKFAKGLYGEANDANHTTLYFVHCSDGSNPCVP